MECSSALSRHARAAPIAPQTIPYRASLRQLSGPRNPSTPGRIASAGSRTSSITSSEVTDARSDIFRWMSGALNPGRSHGTRKPRIPSSVFAHTTATSETPPFVIHIFVPFTIQSAPSRRAVVRIELGSLPLSGSDRPKQPIASPLAIRGNQCAFCSSEPNEWIAYIASALWTETNERRPESPASSSSSTKP